MAMAQRINLPYDLRIERSIELPRYPKLLERRNGQKRLFELSAEPEVNAIKIRNGQEYNRQAPIQIADITLTKRPEMYQEKNLKFFSNSKDLYKRKVSRKTRVGLNRLF